VPQLGLGCTTPMALALTKAWAIELELSKECSKYDLVHALFPELWVVKTYLRAPFALPCCSETRTAHHEVRSENRSTPSWRVLSH